MRQRYVGGSGLQVSELSLGTAGWGSEVDDDTAAHQLHTFLDAGGTVIDSAPFHAHGAAESILGSLLEDTVARRDIVIMSRAGLHPGKGLHPGEKLHPGEGLHRGEASSPGGRGTSSEPAPSGARLNLSRHALLDELDATLASLGTDHVDVWMAQGWDGRVPLQETLSAFEHAVSTGRARYAGLANHAGWQFARAASLSAVPLVAHQVQYSLLHREPEAEVVPAARNLGAGIVAWAPLGGGVLTGKYRGRLPAASRAADDAHLPGLGPYLSGRSARITDAVVTAARGLDRLPLDLALSWLLGRADVATAVVGARTNEQLEEILGAGRDPLPTQIADVLSEVSHPGS